MKFLFDLGGVFFDWNPEYFYENIFTSNEELIFFLTNVCNNNWNIKQDAGRTIKEAVEELVKKYPHYENEIKLYYSNHRKMIRKVYQDSINTLLMLKDKNFSCFVLSNWSAETFMGMTDDYDFLRKFDGIIISGEEKMIKPNQEIYQLAVDRFKLIPNESVFIDDKLENINTAKNLGFKTIHLVDPSIIEKEINKYLYQ